MKKIALFVFNGEPMCFIHVLLNAFDLKEKGHTPKIIMEGASLDLIPELAKEDNHLHMLWTKAKNDGLVEGFCKACSMNLGTYDSAVNQGLKELADMSGHPGMAWYRDNGYEIITF